MTLQQMIARQRQITEAARNESRSLTAEEQREFDQLQGQIDGVLAGGSGADGSGGNGISVSVASSLFSLGPHSVQLIFILIFVFSSRHKITSFYLI